MKEVPTTKIEGFIPNAEFFAEFVEKTKDVVLTSIGRNLPQEYRHALDDIAQETYFRAFKAMLKGKAPQDEPSWLSFLARLAQHETWRYLKKEKKFQDKHERWFLEKYPQEEKAELRFDAFMSFFRPRLKYRHWEILRLRLEGYKIREIAQMLKIKNGSVKSALSRLKEKIARFYGGKIVF
ncbi:MAG: LuxR C-terminal-related transcriptional regulator [Leptospiraceae bacterium]|nr:LuxR C-terminal-related transcriptional regulator [Leptospiraceae bacterium]MDW8307456.1 sigma factor-like helix-turn-helix DNA-binding protein [Leptospiraceae bacterium]